MLSSPRIMKLYMFTLGLTVIATSYSSAIPKQDEHKNRAYDKDLSDLKHDVDGDHNADYDHEAFLGKDEAKTFDQLTPEESLDGLSKIVAKIDKDKDGKVTEDELKVWIQYVQRRYIVTDTDRLWKDHDITDNVLKWNDYKKRTYGVTEEGGENYNSYKDMITRDHKRWQKADKDKDDILTKEEFMDFLHPEEAQHMQEIVVEETLADIDKDADGFISLEEYIADIYDEDDDDEEDDEDEDGEGRHIGQEPEWVQTERDDFKSHRDKNGDGKLDKDEIRDWIIPEDYDHSVSEAKHLFAEADEDRDGILTKEEILDKHDLFVGSQATDFGDALLRHDEF